MKIQIALIALSLTLTSVAQAANANTCAFGDSSSELSDKLDYTGEGKIWYKGEELSVHNRQRLQGLSNFEKKMILVATNVEAGKEEEGFDDFISSDGYITYFSHNSNGREFAEVASFPGDNRFGVIFEIKRMSRGNEYKILGVVAVISDGDFEDCKVFN